MGSESCLWCFLENCNITSFVSLRDADFYPLLFLPFCYISLPRDFFLNMMQNISGERRDSVISNVSMQWENNFSLVSRHNVDFSQMPSLHSLRKQSSSEGGVYFLHLC